MNELLKCLPPDRVDWRRPWSHFTSSCPGGISLEQARRLPQCHRSATRVRDNERPQRRRKHLRPRSRPQWHTGHMKPRSRPQWHTRPLRPRSRPQWQRRPLRPRSRPRSRPQWPRRPLGRLASWPSLRVRRTGYPKCRSSTRRCARGPTELAAAA